MNRTELLIKTGRAIALTGALGIVNIYASCPYTGATLASNYPYSAPAGDSSLHNPFVERHQDEIQRQRDTIASFSIEDVENEAKLRDFVNTLAQYYIEATESKTASVASLTDPQKLVLTYDRDIYLIAAKEDPYAEKTYARFDPNTKVISMDLSMFIENRRRKGDNVGIYLARVLFEEWTHQSAIENRQGALLNNPDNPYCKLPDGIHVWEWYQGGIARYEDKQSLWGFEEIWVDTLMRRLFFEKFDIEIPESAYYFYGTYFFEPLTTYLGISVSQLFNLHASSDLEGFAILIGSKLPGDENALDKGMRLFHAIGTQDENALYATGVLTLLGQG